MKTTVNLSESEVKSAIVDYLARKNWHTTEVKFYTQLATCFEPKETKVMFVAECISKDGNKCPTCGSK